MATVVVIDLTNVTVDGTPAGSVTDVLTNFKNVAGIRGDVLRAVQAWDAGRVQSHAAALTAKDASHAAAVATLNAAHAAKLAEAQATIDTLRTYVDAVAGTDEAKRLAKVKRRAELEDARAKADAELAAAVAGIAELDANPE